MISRATTSLCCAKSSPFDRPTYPVPAIAILYDLLLKDIQNIRGDREIIKDGKKIKNTTKWYKLPEDTGIEYRDLKNCRDTFAVSAIESKKFTMQQVAGLLGHADLQMIINHYAKYIEKKVIKADRKINLFGDT